MAQNQKTTNKAPSRKRDYRKPVKKLPVEKGTECPAVVQIHSPVSILPSAYSPPAYSPAKIHEYRAHVQKLFSTHSGLLVSNGEPAHAVILIEALLRSAEQTMVIFCRDLNPAIYDSGPELFRELVGAVVDRKVSLRVITQEEPKSSRFKTMLEFLAQAKGTGTVRLFQCEPDNSALKLDTNFIAVDSKSFRFETDRDNFRAFACANCPGLAEQMEAQFERCIQKGVKQLIPLPA